MLHLKVSPSGMLMFKVNRGDFIDNLDYRDASQMELRKGIMEIPIRIVRTKPDGALQFHNYVLPVAFRLNSKKKDVLFKISGKYQSK